MSAFRRSGTDCTGGYACLFDTTTYSGRTLKWSASGVKKLAGVSFRDKAGSTCNNRWSNGIETVDYRTGMIDPWVKWLVGGCWNMAKKSYLYGGNWNNRTDQLELL
ncbi:peptidase inhibitor family I36 protein [Streptomyces albidoflavus]|uniref:peptidase inhibitor family I36 protein n=1 Tax=Streptomyces albidoflavus TaxID=1886 RepID=UPI0033BF78FE